MLGESQVAAPLMARRAAHRALSLAYRRFQPGPGVGVQLARLWLSRKPQRPARGQLRHETLILALALLAPAAVHPRQHGAVWRQRGRQVAPCGHTSTVRQRGNSRLREGRRTAAGASASADNETEALRRRAELEQRSMQEVPRQAIREHADSHSRAELLDKVLDEELPAKPRP
jgi:hypothetical protein